MKPLTLTMTAALAVAFASSPAYAQRKRKPKQRVAGVYEVKFEEVGNSCGDRGFGLSRGRIKLKRTRGRRMSLTIPLIPLLTGVVSRDGKFRARAKLGSTNTVGMQGRFAANGRVDDGVIQLVLIAEYFTKKRPLCTQSWNVSGIRKDAL